MNKIEKIRKEICFHVINYEANQEMLKKHPHMKVLDLAALFYYKKSKGGEKGEPVMLYEKDLRDLGISQEELYEMAQGNMPKLLPPIFQTIEQVIGDISREEDLPVPCESEPRERMYVLTNEEKYLGAGCFLYPRMLEQIYLKLKVEFFVLPSSIHECIIMPDVGSVNATNLKNLVTEMNEKFLEGEEVLSNQVYHYDGEKAELVIA